MKFGTMHMQFSKIVFSAVVKQISSSCGKNLWGLLRPWVDIDIYTYRYRYIDRGRSRVWKLRVCIESWLTIARSICQICCTAQTFKSLRNRVVKKTFEKSCSQEKFWMLAQYIKFDQMDLAIVSHLSIQTRSFHTRDGPRSICIYVYMCIYMNVCIYVYIVTHFLAEATQLCITHFRY